MYVFNLSKQSERIQKAVVDITIKTNFSENVGAHARAYAIVISDRRLKFQSDGRKTNVSVIVYRFSSITDSGEDGRTFEEIS